MTSAEESGISERMSRRELLFEKLTHYAIVGVVRENDADDAWQIASRFADGGIQIVEITLTTPDAFSLIARLQQRYGGKGLTVAAGTVRGSNDAAEARRAGAEMLVSPHTDVRVIEYAVENDLLCVAGAATATEIIHAWESGANVVKVFPAASFGGPDYIRVLRGPIRDIPLLAGGPVPLEQIDAYLEAGAVGVNLGVSLAVPDLVRERNWEEISRRVSHAVSIIRARGDEAVTVH